MAFFSKWWFHISKEKQEIVRKLLKNGQLEIINGGWVMNDEACTYYDDIIDQMTLGHKFMLDNLNITTDIGWHIDPFGHSTE
jgi:lysosomal alpha-mannosidase